MTTTAPTTTAPTTTAPPATRSRRGRPPAADGPDKVDVHVGSRIRLRRMLLGLSQQKLGEAIGITFQQIQKYERGANRVSASKLAAFSRVLDVSVSFFFDSMENSSSANTTFSRFDDDFDRQEMELVRIYRAMPERLRPHWFQLGRAMGSAALDVAAAE